MSGNEVSVRVYYISHLRSFLVVGGGFVNMDERKTEGHKTIGIPLSALIT